MLGSEVTSVYPGNHLQREAERNSVLQCPEKPFPGSGQQEAISASHAVWFGQLKGAEALMQRLSRGEVRCLQPVP